MKLSRRTFLSNGLLAVVANADRIRRYTPPTLASGLDDLKLFLVERCDKEGG